MEGAAEGEGLEAYHSRATAAILLGVTERNVELRSEGGGSRAGEDCRGRDGLFEDEGRRPLSLSPSEGSKAAGRGPKRFRRDLDEGRRCSKGIGIGRGSLVSSNGGNGGGKESSITANREQRCSGTDGHRSTEEAVPSDRSEGRG